MPQSITVAVGNGIGPEIMKAVLHILEKAGADIHPEYVEIGETIYNKGIPTGIENQTWESLYRNKIFLKAPITTPQGGGFKSLNVTVRKTLGLYANVRRSCSYHPVLPTKHNPFDVVIVRENEEDLYSGIEHRQTNQVHQCLKLVSKNGCERISEFAFEYALQNNRKKVSCFSKDNIMKMTDGLMHQCFEEKSKLYPSIQAEHWIIDIGCAKLADTPENFDVVVTGNLYGDILSDMTAQMSGSVGMGGSSNIGNGYAMFEAIHGSAPKRAGQNLANPSGLLLASIDMLVHIGQTNQAEKIKNAWLKTLEDGIHTYDIFNSEVSKKKAGTKEFAQAVIDRLGEKPSLLSPAKYESKKTIKPFSPSKEKNLEKKWVGVDIFFDKKINNISQLAKDLQNLGDSLKLISIYCRGLEVWPGPQSHLQLSDHWGVRFISQKDVSTKNITDLILKLEEKGFSFIKAEGLFSFNEKMEFSGKKTPLELNNLS